MRMRLFRGTIIAVTLLLSAALHAQNTFNGTGSAQFISDTGDLVGLGRTWTLSPSDGVWLATLDDPDNDGVPETVRVSFQATPGGPASQFGPFWGWEFNTVDVPTDLVIGTFIDAERASRTTPGHPGLAVIGDGAACLVNEGEFTIIAFEYCSAFSQLDGRFNVTLVHLEASYEQHCEGQGPALRGTVIYDIRPDLAPENCDAGGGPGGGDTPAPPPPFQVSVPIEFDIEPLLLGSTASHEIKFTTAVTSSFNSDIHLSVETDALEHEDFHASITPSVIPAPGAGEGKLTITTGPLTFPRVYSVKLIATANDQVFTRTFLVQVNCDPPFILGTNQPKSITAANGSQVTLEVTPSGTGPFSYQWYRGFPGMTRSPVLAANESKLIFTTRETATYWVRVSNACGTVNSGSATVTTTGTLSGPARRRGGS